MKRTFLTLGLIWIVLETGAQREEFMESGLAMTTRVYQNLIGSATCFISGVPVSDPAIQLNSGDQLELHFDALGSSYHDYTFFAVHCDANWNPTDLEANEYIQGFNTLNISDFDDSFNTRVPYVHYRAYFPCDLMKPRYSGNYLLVVTPEDEGGNPVLTQRVVVYEQICPLTLEAKLSSTVSHRYSHQEVDARLGTRDYQIFNASEDLHVTILQNFDWSTAKTNIQPQFIKSDEITFDLYEVNEFEAGNQWRWFETRDLNYISMQVDRIEQLLSPEIEVFLRPDVMQGGKGHITDPDINGRFMIESKQGGDDDLESEYHHVFFYLKSPEFPAAEIYITGNLRSSCNSDFRMHYNAKAGHYEAALFLKQGYYNYRYLMTDPYNPKGTLEYTEGNYSQTENQYTFIVYHYNHAVGYDRIIAFERDNSLP